MGGHGPLGPLPLATPMPAVKGAVMSELQAPHCMTETKPKKWFIYLKLFQAPQKIIATSSRDMPSVSLSV